MPTPTVQEQFKTLIKLVKSERMAMIESCHLIGVMHDKDAPTDLGFGNRDDYIKALGLSKSQYYDRLHAFRLVGRFPEFLTLWKEGKTELSCLREIPQTLSPEYGDLVAEILNEASKREVKAFMSNRDKYGHIVDPAELPYILVPLKLTAEEYKKLQNLRDVLSSQGTNVSEHEAFMAAVEDTLKNKDPMAKAKRHKARKQKKAETEEDVGPAEQPIRNPQDQAESEGEVEEKKENRRTPIPAAVKHEVILRDEGKCTFVGRDGRRCGERSHLEFDHIEPICRGGGNEETNIRILCRKHNRAEVKRLMGEAYLY